MSAFLGIDDQVELEPLFAGEVFIGSYSTQPIHAARVLKVHRGMLAHQITIGVVHGDAGQGDVRGPQFRKYHADHLVIVAIILLLRSPGMVGYRASIAPIGEVGQQEEADLGMGPPDECDVIDKFIGCFLHRVETPTVPTLVRVHQPTNRPVQVQEIHPSAGGVEFGEFCQLDSRRGLPVRFIHGSEVQGPAAFDGDLVAFFPNQADQLL